MFWIAVFAIVIGLLYYKNRKKKRAEENECASMPITNNIEQRSVKDTNSYPYEVNSDDEKFYMKEYYPDAANGYVVDIQSLCLFYQDTEPNAEKYLYWKRKYDDLLEQENVMALASVYSDVYLAKHLYSANERVAYRAKYEKIIKGMAEEGNPYACMAIGMFGHGPNANILEEIIPWLQKAADAGISDAWYAMAIQYGILSLYDENHNRRPQSTEQYRGHEIYCCRQGIAASSGILREKCRKQLELLLA